MHDLTLYSPMTLCLLTTLVVGAGSLLPVSPVEPLIVAAGAVASPALRVLLIALATAAAMSAKTLLYLGGRAAPNRLPERQRKRVERVRQRLAGRPWLRRLAMVVSGATGVPPFYVMTALSGTAGWPLGDYVICGTSGQALRFAALVFLPQLVIAPLAARAAGAEQSPGEREAPAYTDSGSGPDAYVLLSGLVGGVAGFHRAEARLVAQGHRVIAIDPYQLSLDSADVSFDALARRVERILAQFGVTSAHIVGHAHGGGVALRLAANAPDRVSDLYLVDVGAKSSARGQVLSGALRLVPILTHIPGGKGFVRRRFVKELRENSGRTDWLDDSTQHAYVEPMLRHIGPAIALAFRVGSTDEPEPLDAVLARVHVPVTVLLGELPHASGPDDAEMRALEKLGTAVRIHHLAGVAHFPHEEAPDEFVRLLLLTSPRTLASATRSGGGL